MTPPRYQSITRDALRLLTSDDGGALIRLVAGDIDGFTGPGVTHSDHLRPCDPCPRGGALRPVESGIHRLGLRADRTRHRRSEARPMEGGRLVVFGPGGHLVLAATRQAEPLDVLLPIRAPIAHYGPFVMNTRDELLRAVEDYQAGRLGIVPADQLAPRRFA